MCLFYLVSLGRVSQGWDGRYWLGFTQSLSSKSLKMPMTFQLCKEPTVTVEPIAPVVQSSVKSVAPKWDPSMPVEPRYKVKVRL